MVIFIVVLVLSQHFAVSVPPSDSQYFEAMAMPSDSCSLKLRKDTNGFLQLSSSCADTFPPLSSTIIVSTSSCV